jgi:hypothetical protein
MINLHTNSIEEIDFCFFIELSAISANSSIIYLENKKQKLEE